MHRQVLLMNASNNKNIKKASCKCNSLHGRDLEAPHSSGNDSLRFSYLKMESSLFLCAVSACHCTPPFAFLLICLQTPEIAGEESPWADPSWKRCLTWRAAWWQLTLWAERRARSSRGSDWRGNKLGGIRGREDEATRTDFSRQPGRRDTINIYGSD